MFGRMAWTSGRVGMLCALFVTACGGAGVREESASTMSATLPSTSTSPSDTGTDTTDGSSEEDSATTEKLDAGVDQGGCKYLDLLFVIDNSDSMAPYQVALAEAFPGFVDGLFAALPPGVDVHVAITTTEFDRACGAHEATQNCQSTATLEEVESHYVKPTDAHDGGNGSQGRLFQWAGRRWFETNSDADPAELEAWFSAAATAAGEDGCSFEMPVAGAGWVTHPANAETNEGFLRDERGLFVIFFLTDEPDKSPESKNVYRDMILEAKQGCGGEACVFASGLIPACTVEINQKLWQFLKAFGDDPPWGDILATDQYAAHFEDALAGAVAQACEDVPIP